MRSTLRRAPAFAVACVAVLALAGGAGASFNTSRLVSAGTNGTDTNVAFQGVSSDGSKVFFTTTDPVVGADSDTVKDIYMRSGGVTTLVTPNTSRAATFQGMTPDGSTVFFTTTEKIDPADTDTSLDIYSVTNGVYTLWTPNTPGDVAWAGNSADGSHVFFTSADNSLDPSNADTDGLSDLYQRAGGATTLLSPNTADATTANLPSFEGASTDGSIVYWTSPEKVVAGDTDTNTDIYRDVNGGAPTLATPNTTAAVAFSATSPDGSKLYFTSANKLDAGGAALDTDTFKDVYTGMSAPYTLLTPGTTGAGVNFVGITDDGSHLFVTSVENLNGSDADGLLDIYDRSGGAYTLLTPGTSSATTPVFKGASSDGSKIWFVSAESLAGDGDGGLNDVFQSDGGTISLASRPGAGATGSPATVTWGGRAPDGSRIFFNTAERLTGDDTDTNQDVYEALTDSVAPTLTPSQSPNGSNQWFKTAPATIHLAASDDIGLQSLSCNLDNAAAALANTTSTQTTAAGDLATSAEGDHAVDCSATDGGGNVFTLPTQHLKLDATAPAITPSQSPGPNGYFTTAPATLHVEASDAVSLDHVSCTLDGSDSPPAVSSQTATTLSGDVTTSVDGTHTVVCTAYDSAGNSTATTAQQLKLDSSGPLVSFGQTPDGTNGWFKTAPAKLHVSASDVSGVASLSCAVDGGMPVTLDPAAGGDIQTSVQGTHLVACTAVDAAGNQTVAPTQTLELDSIAPVVTPTAPSGWVGTAPATAQVAVTETSPSSLGCTIDGGGPVGLPAAGGNVQTSLDGDHTVVCTATDLAGNTGQATFHLMLDTGAPVISFSPADGSVWQKTSPAKVGVTASDGAAIDTLACTLDGAGSLTNTGGNGTTQLTGDMTTSAQGDHVVFCTAKDKAGNQITASRHLKLDSQAPVVTPTGPSGWVTTPPASMHVVATDANLTGLSCKLDGVAYTLQNQANSATSTAGDVVTSVNADHSVDCTATDAAGNTTVMPTFHLKLDTAPTTFAFTQAANAAGWQKASPAKLHVTATDNSGISALTCKLDNVAATLTGVTSTSTSRSGDVSTTGQGSHTVVCTATDNTSVSTDSPPQTLKLDSVAPTLTVANLAVDPTSSSGATVSSYNPSASDGTSGPVTVTCTPALPRLFPMGNTSASCTATDQAGNATTTAFTVHVNTVVDMLNVLRTMVTKPSPPFTGTIGPILTSYVDFAITYMTWPTKPKPADACGKLNAFTSKIATEMAKPKPGMTAAQASSLTAYANKIKTLIPC